MNAMTGRQWPSDGEAEIRWCVMECAGGDWSPAESRREARSRFSSEPFRRNQAAYCEFRLQVFRIGERINYWCLEPAPSWWPRGP